MRLIISIPVLLLLGACADFGYYWHSASGHLALMRQRNDIEDMLADSSLDRHLRERLLLVREIREFSIRRLALPDNDSYENYVALDRPYVVQNLFAAPEFSTQLHSWCYPLVGCASYRGYFDAERLQDFVEELKAQGLEVHIGQVAAYSTLGWFDDPVLSSFIDWPDYRLAGLLFHELTHQRIYIDDDTRFNESLASAVQQAGTELWLVSNNQQEQLGLYHRWIAYRDQVLALIEETRDDLNSIYRQEISDSDKRVLKEKRFDLARASHDEIAARFGIEQGFARWFETELNNAKIGSVSVYNDQLPAFINLIASHDGNFEAFFAYVERLAKLKRSQRDDCLESWRNKTRSDESACPGF